MYKSEKLFLQFSSYKIHVLNFFPNIFCAVCIFLSYQVVPYLNLVWFYKDSQRHIATVLLHHGSPVSATALHGGSNTKSKCSSVPWLPKYKRPVGWVTRMNNEVGKENNLFRQKGWNVFLEQKWFSPGLLFHDFFPPFNANNLQRQKRVYRKGGTSAWCQCCEAADILDGRREYQTISYKGSIVASGLFITFFIIQKVHTWIGSFF